jgi:F0F1-type ATP synthase membrane subunit b/b'
VRSIAELVVDAGRRQAMREAVQWHLKDTYEAWLDEQKEKDAGYGGLVNAKRSLAEEMEALKQAKLESLKELESAKRKATSELNEREKLLEAELAAKKATSDAEMKAERIRLLDEAAREVARMKALAAKEIELERVAKRDEAQRETSRMKEEAREWIEREKTRGASEVEAAKFRVWSFFALTGVALAVVFGVCALVRVDRVTSKKDN